MEPISLLLTAIVSGAAAALEPTAGQAVKDAYAGLKSLIKRKWGTVGVESVEQNPKSASRQEVLKEDLEKAGAARDAELLAKAQQLVQAVAAHAPQAAQAAGISLAQLKAAGSVNIRNLLAEGGISVSEVSAGQDLNIEGLQSKNPTGR